MLSSVSGYYNVAKSIVKQKNILKQLVVNCEKRCIRIEACGVIETNSSLPGRFYLSYLFDIILYIYYVDSVPHTA